MSQHTPERLNTPEPCESNGHEFTGPDCVCWRCGCEPDDELDDRPIQAGRSDKYGQVFVERYGNTGFDDPSEPVAMLRAQDDHAYYAMIDYLQRCGADPEVDDAQVASVRRQVEAFGAFRREHPERIRKPGRVRT